MDPGKDSKDSAGRVTPAESGKDAGPGEPAGVVDDKGSGDACDFDGPTSSKESQDASQSQENGGASRDSRSCSPSRDETQPSGEGGDSGASWGKSAGQERPTHKRRLEHASDEDTGVASSCGDEERMDGVSRKKAAYSCRSDSPLRLRERRTASDSSEEEMARTASGDAVGSSLPGRSSRPLNAADLLAVSSSSRLPALLSRERTDDKDFIRDAHALSPADSRGESFGMASFSSSHPPAQSDYHRAKQLWNLEKAFDAFWAEQKMNGRRQGCSVPYAGRSHPAGACTTERSDAACSSPPDLSRAELEELCRQHGVSPRELGRILGGMRSISGKSPEDLKAASWTRQRFPPSAFAPPNLSPTEVGVYLQQRAALDHHKRLRERWGLDAGPVGSQVFGENGERHERLTQAEDFLSSQRDAAGREAYQLWYRSRGARDFRDDLRTGLAAREASSSRRGDYAASSRYSLPAHRTAWPSADSKQASGSPPSKLNSSLPGLWNVPHKPQPYTYADVQEAMEGPEGVLRVSRPHKELQSEEAEDEDGRAFASLPKGAETLFWSRGRGLYFLRQLERKRGGEDDLVGEAGFWVAASEEESGGFIIHRKFSVAKFGFEHAKMLALRWYNERQEARRGQQGLAISDQAKPEGMPSDRAMSREGNVDASRFRSSLSGEPSDKPHAEDRKRIPGSLATENPRQKSRIMDTSCPVPGVRYDSRDRAWLATWHDGVRQYKRCFSIKKYGFAKAKECAIRMKMSLNAQTGGSPSGARSSGAFSAPFRGAAQEPARDTFSVPADWARARSAGSMGAFSSTVSEDREANFARDEELASRRSSLSDCLSLLRSVRGESRSVVGPAHEEERREESGKTQAYRGLVESLLANLSPGSDGGRGSPPSGNLSACKRFQDLHSRQPHSVHPSSSAAPVSIHPAPTQDAGTSLDRAGGRGGDGVPGFLAASTASRRGGREAERGEKSAFESSPNPYSEARNERRGPSPACRGLAALSADLASPHVAEEVEEFLRSLSTHARQALLESLRRGSFGEDGERLALWSDACKVFAARSPESAFEGRDERRQDAKARDDASDAEEKPFRERAAGFEETTRVNEAARSSVAAFAWGRNGREIRETARSEGPRGKEHFWNSPSSCETPAWEQESGETPKAGALTLEGGPAPVAGLGEKAGGEEPERRFDADEALDRDDELATPDVHAFTHLTSREWELLDYLETLDFEAVDLDAVMPLINQVPKVRGVCFDRKGLYWISQWHSQQKKHREWFGVKRLGFRKAWALAVCVRRDAEKVEDEPIDYPRIPDYEEVLGVTYARCASGRYWVAHYARPALSPPSPSACLGFVGRKLFPVSESSFEEARRQAVALVSAFPLPRAFFFDPERRTALAFESTRAGEGQQASEKGTVSKRRLFNVFTWLNGGASWTNVRRWAHSKRMQLAEDEWPQQCVGVASAGKLTDNCGDPEKERAEPERISGSDDVKGESRNTGRPGWLVSLSASPATGETVSSSSYLGSQKPSPLIHAEHALTRRDVLEERETASPPESAWFCAKGDEMGQSVSRAVDASRGGKAKEEEEPGMEGESRQATLGAVTPHGSGLGVGASACDEEGMDEAQSPLDIDSIVADAYESFSDEDAEGEGDGAKAKRIRLPKIGGVYYKRDGNYKAWAASWHIQGKRTRRYFTVKKHGFRNAYLKAVRARREAERHEGISVKHRHHALVPGQPGSLLGTKAAMAEEAMGSLTGDDSRMPRASASQATAAFAGDRGPRDRAPGLDRAKADEEVERGLTLGASEALRGEKAADGLAQVVRRDCAVGGGVVFSGSEKFVAREEGGQRGDAAEAASRQARQGCSGEDSRGAPSRIPEREVLLSSSEVSVHLTPLERVAKAIDLDLDELTDRVWKVARRGEGGSRLFHRRTVSLEEDELTGDEASSRSPGAQSSKGQGVPPNLEFAMARETLDVLLSDLYSVVVKLSGAGRWASLATPAAAESAEPLESAWTRRARDATERRPQSERGRDARPGTDEMAYPSSTAQIDVVLQVVVIKHYLAKVRAATRGEQIAPLLALFEPCIKQGMMPHQCSIPRLRWLVCQLCRASIPWLDERNVLTDALLYRHLEELEAEDESQDEMDARAGQIIFSAGFDEGRSGDVETPSVFTAGEPRLVGGFRTDSGDESVVDKDETSLAALICLPKSCECAEKQSADGGEDLGKDGAAALVRCESGEKTDAEPQSFPATELAATSVSESEGKDGSSDAERQGETEETKPDLQEFGKRREDERVATPRTSSATTASGDTPEKPKTRAGAGEALRRGSESGPGTPAFQKDEEAGSSGMKNVKGEALGPGGTKQTGERRGQSFPSSGGDVRRSGTEETPEKTVKCEPEPSEGCSRRSSRCGTPRVTAAASCPTVESDVPA
ncbi:unnamed protein product [Neospora caninum Liverpool]|uniref:AP2 domain transcription factor AP2XII-1 n=1 Tax=Neospora caninum (strain Liverpool) TaxID=572307 RepID=F0VPS0_NEOCL|nr:uncharacterized protein NCLIV_061420 [Neospora caninum Liverpool]CBZ55717.1 unnamed protein product [Neospora caninum Liverpool]CEL70459.1 TPA: AP2 domain transcription factor AP2XII-1 [Neospora caninum Liverpool]|eukprot:XP_003885743.1 uncharacterized protein NCLIV_061420 [Neospora caninum Liverpool]